MPNRNESLRPRSNKKHHVGNKNPDFDLGRRRLVKALGWGALGLLAAGAVGTLFLNSNDQDDTAAPNSELTGEVQETKLYLQKLDSKVQKDSSKLKEYLPQIASLAVSYFSRQMGDMFPERKFDYDKKRFENKFVFLSSEDYLDKEKLGVCNEPIGDKDLAFIDVVNGSVIYINKDLKFASNPVLIYFFIMLHELHHFAASKKSYSPEIHSLGIPKPVRYEKGLKAFVIDDNLSALYNRECVVGYRSQLEEAVVQHSALKLFNRFGLYLGGTAYDQFVKDYDQEVINRLYGGSYRELLDYQQQTKPNDFFRSIGRKVLGGPAEDSVEIVKGDNFVRRVLLGGN